MRIFLIALAALALACSGESPTIPAPDTTTRLTMVLRSASDSTIRRATLHLDGRQVAEATFATPVAEAVLEARVIGVPRGTHSIKLFIVEQTASPSRYAASGGVGTADRQILLAPVQGTLATGESLELVVTF